MVSINNSPHIIWTQSCCAVEHCLVTTLFVCSSEFNFAHGIIYLTMRTVDET